MMWDWTGNGWLWGWWILHGLGSLLYLVVIIVAIVVLARVLGGSGRAAHTRGALVILQERYAKGEIDREEYLQKKQDLGG
ncbi:MAG: SHOCT domain-containing protein [Rhizomicrobium sp.]|jgi:putative membrane protein